MAWGPAGAKAMVSMRRGNWVFVVAPAILLGAFFLDLAGTVHGAAPSARSLVDAYGDETDQMLHTRPPAYIGNWNKAPHVIIWAKGTSPLVSVTCNTLDPIAQGCRISDGGTVDDLINAVIFTEKERYK